MKMLVLIDLNKENIILYGEKGITSIPFYEAEALSSYSKNEKIFYITQALETNAQEVIKLVNQVKGQKSNSDVPETNINLYLHSVSPGTVYINENFNFKGKYDCKLIDDEIKEIMETSPLLKSLIKDNKIKIIGEKSKQTLLQELKEEQNKIKELKEKEDAKLDALLLDKPALQPCLLLRTNRSHPH